MSMSSRTPRNRRSARAAIAATLTAVVLLASGASTAAAFKYPDAAEARLLLDGTQGAPHDGFNMQIDTNGFGAAGGDVIDTHMFCINGTLPYQCDLPNQLVRVQAEPAVAGLSSAEANRLAWILTHRSGYTRQETQYAIWCVTDPGAFAPVGDSDQLCNDSLAFAVPAAPVLTLSTLGAGDVTEGDAIHFSLTTNAKAVALDASDGGSGPELCGSAPGNAFASIHADGRLVQQPVSTRTFELCLERDGFDPEVLDVTLTAALDATVTNLQVWVHPDGPQSCQGVIDTQVSSQRVTASASGRWRAATGSLTIRKSTVGDVPAGATFTVHVEGDDVSLDHVFPDAAGDPYEHTFTGLAAGTYTVTETLTGGATTVEITAGGVAVVERNDETVVEVVNSYTGNLVLEKVTDIPVDEAFEFTIECTYLDDPVGDWNNPIVLTGGETFDTGQLPAGTTCTVIESDDGGAQSTTFVVEVGDVHSEGVGSQAGASTIGANDTVEVTFTNRFGQGSTTSSSIVPSSVPGPSTTTDDTVGPGGSTTSAAGGSATTAGGGGGGSGLPVTGGEAAVVLWLAVLALLGGFGLVLSGYRRGAVRRG
jgi:hypothetical protein